MSWCPALNRLELLALRERMPERRKGGRRQRGKEMEWRKQGKYEGGGHDIT